MTDALQKIAAYTNDELATLARELMHPSYGWRRTELLRALATVEEMREAGVIVARNLSERDEQLTRTRETVLRLHEQIIAMQRHDEARQEAERSRTAALEGATSSGESVAATTGEESAASHGQAKSGQVGETAMLTPSGGPTHAS